MASNTTDDVEDIMTSSGGDDGYQEAIKYIWVVGGSILIVVGTIGNLLALAVLTRPKLRRSNAAVYLMVVAVTDLAVLYTGLLRQIIYTSTGRDIREDSEFSCKLHTALVYFFLDFSAWLLAALSLERLLSVCWPHKIRQKCTRMTSICVITGIGVTLFAINAHFLGTMGDMMVPTPIGTLHVKCVPLSEDFYYVVSSVWPWVDLSVFALLPLTIHIVCNIFIVRRVVSSFQESRRNRDVGPPAATSRHQRPAVVARPTETAGSSSSGRGSSRVSRDSPSSLRRHDNKTPGTGRDPGEMVMAMESPSSSLGNPPHIHFDGLSTGQAAQQARSQHRLPSSIDAGAGRPSDSETFRQGNNDIQKTHTDTAPNTRSRVQVPGRYTAQGNRPQNLTGHQHHQRASAFPVSSATQRFDHRVSSMTVMLVTVSSVFCLTTLPISIYSITIWILVEHGYDTHHGKIAWPVLNILMYTNNSINFILYSLSGSRFRAELKILWQSLCKRLPRPVSFRRSSAKMSSSMTSSRSGKSKSSVEIRRWSSNTETSTVESHDGKKRHSAQDTAAVDMRMASPCQITVQSEV